MRPFDQMPADSDDFSQIALLVAETREWPSPEFTRSLDARAARRFAPVAPAAPARRARQRLLRAPVLGTGLMGGFAVAVAAVVIGTGALSNSSPALLSASNGNTHSAASHPPTSKIPATAFRSSGVPSQASTTAATAGPKYGAASTGQMLGAYQNDAAVPAPAGTSGGRQIQSAQLTLSTSNNRIDTVAQEVYDVVAQEHGTVSNSQVTAGTRAAGGSYANFSLSIPTANLQQALTRMSALRYAHVSSRTDGTQNVSGQYANDQRQIADQKAVRQSLLKQLETAYTTGAIDSIKAQLKLTEQQLDSDEATLQSLQHKISYSSLQVQINASAVVVPVHPVAKGLTLGRASHDAGQVLVVAAGVALIACAAALPLGLLVALVAWIGFWVRRRRREHALDAS